MGSYRDVGTGGSRKVPVSYNHCAQILNVRQDPEQSF